MKPRPPISGSYSELVRAVAIAFKGEYIVLRLEDTRELAVPIAWYPRLARATAAQKANGEWIGNGIGISWPEIDEDLEIQGMLDGRKSPEYGKGLSDIGKWFEVSGGPSGVTSGSGGGRLEKRKQQASRVDPKFTADPPDHAATSRSAKRK